MKRVLFVKWPRRINFPWRKYHSIERCMGSELSTLAFLSPPPPSLPGPFPFWVCALCVHFLNWAVLWTPGEPYYERRESGVMHAEQWAKVQPDIYWFFNGRICMMYYDVVRLKDGFFFFFSPQFKTTNVVVVICFEVGNTSLLNRWASIYLLEGLTLGTTANAAQFKCLRATLSANGPTAFAFVHLYIWLFIYFCGARCIFLNFF